MIKDIPYLSPEELPKVPFVINGISSRFIRENRIVPLELKNNVLKVVMANPDDTSSVDALRVASAADVMIYTSDIAALRNTSLICGCAQSCECGRHHDIYLRHRSS